MEVYQIPALTDNYIYILKNKNEVAVIDPSTEEDVTSFLNQKGWALDYILNTHHHHDHVGGNLKLKEKYKSQVLGFEKDRIPAIDHVFKENETWKWQDSECHVIFIPGHTLGHVAFWFKKENMLFCGDTLFAMGCGRLFEGSVEQMFKSLDKLSQLPVNTKVYCGHEYSEKNCRFALSIEENNLDLKKRLDHILNLRKTGQSTVPFTIKEELKTNPFLRTHLWLQNQFKDITHQKLLRELQSCTPVSALDVFKKVRKLRDFF